MSINKKEGSTGNVAADMIYAAVQHYKKFGRSVKTVDLSRSYWKIFKSFMEKQAPEIDIPDEGIQFNNILVRKGSMFQRDFLKVEFYPLISEADSKLPGEKPGGVTEKGRVFSLN